MNVHALRSPNINIFRICKSALICVLACGFVTLSSRAQSCAPPPSGLVAWWKAEQNALDTAGGNNGTVSSNVTFSPGEVGLAFNLDGNHSGITVGNPASLRLQDFTIDAWIKRGSVTQASLDAGGGVLFGYGSFGYQLGMFDNGQIFLSEVSGPGLVVSSSIQLTDSSWHHVAVTKNASTVVFYVDGAAYPAPALNAGFTFNSTATIGALMTGSLQNSFLGLIDELDVFNRALSAAEVQSIYNAASSGKCLSPPAIVTQPAGQTTAVGNSISLSVTVTGSQPLGYQWQFNGVNLVGATASILTLNNLQTTDTGNYSVIVTNPYGSVTSANALLTVNPLGPCSPAPSGLVSWWQGEGNAIDVSGGNNGSILGSVLYSSGLVRRAFSLDGNHSGIIVGNPANLQLQNFTVDAWIKRGSASQASLDAGGGVLFGYGVGGYQLGIFDTGQIFLAQVAMTGQVIGSAVSVTDTGWHHVAVTKNGAVVVFYIDGVGYPAPAFNTTFQFNTTAAIGALPGGALQNTFLGLIDELDVFNRALSAAEVQSIFSANSAGKCPGPPQITVQPVPQVTVVGGTVSFSAMAAGSQPLSYQWQLNGNSLPGATSPTLNLVNVQNANAGNYSVLVSNPYGSTNSANALLTVNAGPPCTPAPSGLVSWWRAEGNATDFTGGNNGVVGGSVTYAAGEVGQAFSFNGNHSGLNLGSPASLQLQNFTIDAWIKRGSATQASLDTGGGVLFGFGPGGYQLGMFDNGHLFMANVGDAFINSSLSVTGTVWHHVAVTRTGATVVFYLDGVADASQTFGPTFQFTNPAAIGGLQSGGLVNTFLGSIDELDVFNRALSTAEIQSIFNAGTAGKCATNTGPTITSQPAGQTTIVGGSASFTVTASGSPPLSFQWQLNGNSLPGATSPTLDLVNVQNANAGNYSVLVSNPYGSTNSANALLIVNPAPVCAPAPSGLISWWQAEGNATDAIGGNNGTLGGNVTPTNGEVGLAFKLDGNHSGITVGNPANLHLQDFTIDAWVNRGSATQTSVESGGGLVFSYGSGGYQLGILDDGRLFLSQVGAPGQLVIGTLHVTGTSWHHVAVTKTGSSVVLYVDGVANPVAVFTATFQFTTVATIGAVLNGGNLLNSFQGSIDELDIFNRALSTAEVQSIFNAGTMGKCPGPPVITSQPVAQTTVAGSTASFSVTAAGAGLLTYQWQLNGANVNGATSPTLNLLNVQNANAGNYSVIVSNPGGSVTSANALLTVNAAPPCAPAPSGLVSWWQAEGSPADFSGGNNATVVGGVSYAAGEVGQAFNIDGNHSGLTVGNPANLQLQNFTIDAWIKRANAAKASLDAGGGVVFGYGNGGYQLGVFDNGQLFLSQVGGPTQPALSPAQVLDLAWHHVAVTKSGTLVTFYVDGVGYPAAAFNATFGFSSTATIGTLSAGGLQNSFLGLIDELDVFNRALSSAEVQTIRNAGIAGKCTGNTAPVIISQPANQTTIAGGSASFTVEAAGSQPLSYQWQLNGANVNGAISPILNLVNVQTANAGNYSVIVSNPYGSSNSINALLTVNPAGTCVPAPSGLVSWWQGEGNPNDFAGGNNGSPGGTVTYAAGEVGQAFVFNGNHSGVTVGNPANLQLQNFTIDAWIKRGDAAHASLDGGGGVLFGYGNGGYQLGIFDNGHIFLANVGSAVIASSLSMTDTGWHHVAVSKTGATVVFYLDGLPDASQTFAQTFQFNNTAAIGGLVTGGLQNTFLGEIDELDVFNRALSTAEVQTIYSVNIAGKCTGNTPPAITVQPANQTVVAGNTASFSVTASGSQPLSYQWQFNGANLTGATSPTLNLVNVLTTSAGNYSVIVSSPYGSVTSASALLTVNPAPPCAPPPSGLVSWWAAEGNTVDQFGANNGTVGGNVTYAPGRVGQAFSLDGNHSGVSVGNPANLQLQDFTIDTWIKRGSATKASLDSGGGVVFGYGTGGYQFAISDTGQMFLDQVGTPGQIVASPVLVTDTAWHHVALTKSGLVVNFYLDGVLSPGPAMSVAFGFTTPATIGAQGAGFQNSFLGSLDEVDVFNRALSASEVLAIYNSGITGKCPSQPTIVTQPVNQVTVAGNSAAFSVTVSGSQPLSYQWQLNGTDVPGATSATLNLVSAQTTDAGNYSVIVSNPYGSVTSANALLTVNPLICSTAPSGLVSWWQGEGNTTDIAGGNSGTIGGNVTYVPGKVGQAFSLDGNHSGITVGNTPNLQLQDFSIDAWIKRGSATQASLDTGGGVVFGYGTGGYQFAISDTGQMFLDQVGTPGQIVGSTVLVADTAWHHVALTKVGLVVNFYLDGVLSPGPAMSVAFGFTTPATIGALSGTLQNSFLGSLDEVDVFNRALSASEVLAIYNASTAGKCGLPPSIVTQPANQAVFIGTNVIFTVGVGGTPPLSYQWTFGGVNIPGATGSTLTLTNVQINQTGSYAVVVANATGSVTSSPATLTVTLPPSQLQIATVTHGPGIITIPINLTARGDENALGFSVKYDKSVLTFIEADPGIGATGASLFVNTNLIGSGELGIALSQPFNTSFTAGAHELVEISFTTAPVTRDTATPIRFGDQPILRQVSNPQAVIIPATYTDGGITITFPGYEADVSPRPTGDNALTIVDWVQVGRFVAGLDTVTNASEFQKADCAPRATSGDGNLTVADWVQAGRYVAGLDPLTYAGGPTTPTPMKVTVGAQQVVGKDSLSRILTAMNSTAQAGQACQVPIQLAALGNENGLEFSVVFDPAALNFTGATVGDGATGANLFVNTAQAASGKIGVVLALPPGAHFAASPLQVLKLNFLAASSAGGSSLVSFTAQPLPQQTVDATAADLPITYVSGKVAITPIASPLLTASYADGVIVLSWPASAAGFNLESNPDPATTNWSTVSSTLVTNATTITTTSPISGSQMFFRLHHP